MKKEQIKNYINENKRIWEANKLSVEEIAERCLLDGEQLGVDKLNGTARLLQILKDRGVIKSWYYNGSYHIGEVAELEKENETLEQGYVWDYMMQAKITTKIVTKEKGVTMFEKEAEEYANHNDWLEFSANVDKIGNVIRTKMERAYIAGATEETKKLQEEINEWKTKFENLQKYLNTQNCYIECAEVWGKLTKGKDLIKRLVHILVLSNTPYERYEEEQKEAEQFLKDCEVEK